MPRSSIVRHCALIDERSSTYLHEKLIVHGGMVQVGGHQRVHICPEIKTVVLKMNPISQYIYSLQ